MGGNCIKVSVKHK